jgi:glutathione S-transferase
MATPKLKLTYFNIKARAEPTRLALHIAGIPFEDVRISHEQWPAMKATMPLGQIPVRSPCRLQLAPLRAAARAAAGDSQRRSGLRARVTSGCGAQRTRN